MRRFSKKVIVASMTAIMLFFTGCSGVITVGPFASAIHTSEDYYDAVNILQTQFTTFAGCKLSEIKYAGDNAVIETADKLGMPYECVIVLNSTFSTEKVSDDRFEPDRIYVNYQWILSRPAVGALWELWESITPPKF